MLNLKKSSVFFSKISKFYLNILNFDIFSVYNFYGSFFFFLNKILTLIEFKNLNYILISTKFIDLIFKNCKNFFKFLSPLSLIFFFSKFNFFFETNTKLLTMDSFFLVGFCYKFFFVSIDKIFILFFILLFY